jgi:hypothetical protein
LFCHLLIVSSLVTCYYFVVCCLSLIVALLLVACCLLFHYLLLVAPSFFACCFIAYYLWLSPLLLPHFITCCFIVVLLTSLSLVASLFCCLLTRHSLLHCFADAYFNGYACHFVAYCLFLMFATLAFVAIISTPLFFSYQLPTPLSLCCCFVVSFVA